MRLKRNKNSLFLPCDSSHNFLGKNVRFCSINLVTDRTTCCLNIIIVHSICDLRAGNDIVAGFLFRTVNGGANAGLSEVRRKRRRATPPARAPAPPGTRHQAPGTRHQGEQHRKEEREIAATQSGEGRRRRRRRRSSAFSTTPCLDLESPFQFTHRGSFEKEGWENSADQEEEEETNASEGKVRWSY